jgi:hypothetical protein
MGTLPADLKKLTEEIKKIYIFSPAGAESSIEALLEGELEGKGISEKVSVIDDLKNILFSKTEESEPAHPAIIDTGVMERLIPLILGRNATTLPAGVLTEKLAQSLNIIFDSLNGLIGLINSTLGTPGEGDETIRHIIGTNLEDAASGKSLEDHLGQVRKAFLITQQAFKDASRSVLGNVLTVLDPKQMEPSQTGLKIGPLKKAESFEIYEGKYSKCRKWFDSGRFMEDLLRQFEKNCQKLFSETRG